MGGRLSDGTANGTFRLDSSNIGINAIAFNGAVYYPGYSPTNGFNFSVSDNTDLYYSNQWQVLEQDRRGDAQEQFTYSPQYVNSYIERDRDTDGNGSLNERLYIQQDANYNVTSVASSGGTIVERFWYDPYGSRTVVGSNFGPNVADGYDFNQGFQGGTLDPLTGLYLFEHRDEDPVLGNWAEPDPMGYVDGSNWYLVDRGIPNNRTDHEGFASESVTHWHRIGPNFVPEIHGIIFHDVDFRFPFLISFGLSGPTPACFEYRQYVSGSMKVNEQPFTTISGLPWNPDWHEDAGVRNGSVINYGHRSGSNSDLDAYTSPDRPTGSSYSMNDNPGVDIAIPAFGNVDFAINLKFWVMVVNVQSGDDLSDPRRIPAKDILTEDSFAINQEFILDSDGVLHPPDREPGLI